MVRENVVVSRRCGIARFEFLKSDLLIWMNGGLQNCVMAGFIAKSFPSG